MFLATTAAAQGPAPVVSPEVSADRRLTLRFRAPDARQVTAAGELDGQPHPMTKGADGVWTVTIGPLAPDIYTYAFTVDGTSALDPQNTNTKLGFGGFGPVSVVEIPGDGPQFYDAKPVPHGEVRIRPGHSVCHEPCGSTRRQAMKPARIIRFYICCTAPATSNRVGSSLAVRT